MDEQQSPSLHGWNPGYGQGHFPGIGGPVGGAAGFGDSFAGPTGFGDLFSGPPALINPTVLPPQSAAAGQGGVGLPGKLADVKAFIDRMGGIDGVISGMSKVHKFLTTMQQFGPLLRLLMTKGKGKAATANLRRPVRRRRSRTGVRAKVHTHSHRPTKRRR